MSLMVPILLKQPVYASTRFRGAFGEGTFPVLGTKQPLAFSVTRKKTPKKTHLPILNTTF